MRVADLHGNGFEPIETNVFKREIRDGLPRPVKVDVWREKTSGKLFQIDWLGLRWRCSEDGDLHAMGAWQEMEHEDPSKLATFVHSGEAL